MTKSAFSTPIHRTNPQLTPVAYGSSRQRKAANLAKLICLLLAVAIAHEPSSASAGTGVCRRPKYPVVPCPTFDAVVNENRVCPDIGYRYVVLSSVPVFLVSEGRTLDNQFSTPAQYKIATSRTETFRVVTSVGTAADLTNKLKLTVNASIEASRTTQLSTEFSLTVPPYTRLIAEYGVNAYHVELIAESYYIYRNRCEIISSQPEATYAPTSTEGWRLTPG